MIHKIILFNPKSYKNHVALFVDRDGVINKKPRQHDYIKSWDEIKFNPLIFDLVKKANSKNYLVIVITNQRGIARGKFNKEDFRELSKSMYKEFAAKKAKINAIYYCPHNYEEKCDCRKPKPGLFLQAIKDFDIEPLGSIMIGDDEMDIQAAKKARIKNLIKIESNNLNKAFESLDKL